MASSSDANLNTLGSSLRTHRRTNSARPRASTSVVAVPRFTSPVQDLVANTPLTPRNQLAAIIHRERLDTIAPRSPRTLASSSSSSATIVAIDPQDTKTTPSTTSTEKLIDKQHELFNPPRELPEDIRNAHTAAVVTERSRRRQERAAKEMLKVQKQQQRVAESSTGITKVVPYNIDKIDSDSDSDEYKQSEVRFYPFDISLENKKPTTTTSPRRAQSQTQTQKIDNQRHSLDIEAIEDIRSNSDDDGDAAVADDDSDTIDDTQVIDDRVKAKNNFVIMQTVLSGKSCCFDFAKVYDTIWYGLKPVVREQFWMSQLATQSGGATEDTELPTFEGLIANGRITRLCYDEIIKDLYRAYPFISQYRPEIDRQTYRALVAYAIYRPDIGYCQGLAHIYMTILLILPHQAQQFRMMENITRRILPYYYDTDMVGVRIDGAVLAAYMRLRCRKLTEFYEKEFATPIEMLTFEIAVIWYFKLFVQVLQGSQLLRIWDMLMLRGPVTLIQFTLQILSYAYKRELFLRQANYLEFIQTMSKHLRALDSIDSILKTRLVDKHIPIEDFDLRRRAATRIQLATLAQQQQSLVQRE